MRGVFVDANDSLAEIFERQRKPGDPDVKVNLDPNIKPDQWPALLGGAEIGVVDHTALPTDVAKQCTGLKHVVFLGTGARSYMNPDELAELGIEVHLIKGYGDTAVAEAAIALMWASAARDPLDGSRDAARQLAARGRHATDRQDARPDRLRRHRGRSRAHRVTAAA